MANGGREVGRSVTITDVTGYVKFWTSINRSRNTPCACYFEANPENRKATNSILDAIHSIRDAIQMLLASDQQSRAYDRKGGRHVFVKTINGNPRSHVLIW